ncbi:transglutaminase family protein [Mucilaginibacter sp. 21P]|uniref:transglutaminase-like domain-containing protein n=1 Tax=Mucilaginibacter sp. 21P TaxID=2778902 RepID=UPI001C596545|nr:transglutaminase family protein [Mucilaginibacter sp. 21P]QXV66011.1 transglutaminase family protein [Mucilaginibacter sp. 21P]
MKFKVSAQLGYAAKSTGTIILNIHALRTERQKVLEETFTITPQTDAEELITATTNNRFIRFDIKEPGDYNITYEALVDNYFEVHNYKKYTDISISNLHPDVLLYLSPSRYCQSDKLYRLAENEFGNLANNYNKAVAITKWIHNHVEYLSGSSTSETSAYDTVAQQAGVCRDFAHLGIALCRALSIPARYFTGYSYMLIPQDFHACFEAYIGGEWLLFDATRLSPLNGFVKIATGRDAADASIASMFGDINNTTIKVDCQLADEGEFSPVYHYPSVFDAVTYM